MSLKNRLIRKFSKCRNMVNRAAEMNNESGSPTAMRLADYFVIVGYGGDKNKNKNSGVLLQRFPEKNWPDCSFFKEIAVFCQPQGWQLYEEKQEPNFFVSVLTEENANRHYFATLTFYEPYNVIPTKPIDEEDETEISDIRFGTQLSRQQQQCTQNGITMYAPKCLVLVSRMYQIETFRQCLGTIYTSWVDKINVPLENIVGNLLGHTHVPPTGGPQYRFSIGGGDRQSIQPPLNSSIPITNTTVAQLFLQLGINNMLILFSAVMTEQKIIFYSKSLQRLSDACHALTSLMYPFRYTHPYIPVLPSHITEITCSPTPFIIGLHESARAECPEVLDVIIVDLDGGSLAVPEGISIPAMPDSLIIQIKEQLSMVLHPELRCADLAFPPLAVKPSIQSQLDKEIRAIFVRTLANLFQGYRTCLLIIRIHPKPLITFHKAKFLGQRGLLDNDFVVRLLDSMFFNQFISERGSPWRPCDLWDDLYNVLQQQLIVEEKDPKLVMIHLQETAQCLANNENPNSQPYVPKIVKPSEGANVRSHASFPYLDPKITQCVIDEGVAKISLIRNSNISSHTQCRIVPIGPEVAEVLNPRHQLIHSPRKLEVLRNCITLIFENQISDAQKIQRAVARSLSDQTAKLVLCQELSRYVSGTRAVLETAQFDMVVRLMQCALKDVSAMDEHGVAAAILPLASTFCKKICTNVIQFAYTALQDYQVWKNIQFWQTIFYTDVQKDIRSLYVHLHKYDNLNNHSNGTSISTTMNTYERSKAKGVRRVESAMDIAGEQLRLQQNLDPEKIKEFAHNEEGSLYSQAIHYANRIVCFLIPLDTSAKRSKERRSNHHPDDERCSNITSVGSDSVGCESAFEEQDPTDVQSTVNKIVQRFVDKVCNDGGVTPEHLNSLNTMIHGIIDMHVETLETVYRESKRIPPIPKPKVPTPFLIPGEEFVMDYLRVYLLSDGRNDSQGTPRFLPAEGGIFLTNYRVIFNGHPRDQVVSELIVTRYFPLTALTKQKRVTNQNLTEDGVYIDTILLPEGIQLRSASFELMRIAFDDEVTNDAIDLFRKTLHKYRHPPHIFSYFAFAGQTSSVPIIPPTVKDKNLTIKLFSKKKLIMSAARKAGLKGPKSSSKKQKYELRDWEHGSTTLPPNTKYHTGGSSNHTSPTKSLNTKEHHEGDEISLGSLSELSDDELSPHPVEPKTAERLMERNYCKDWKRLGLGTSSTKSIAITSTAASILRRAETFRMSLLNNDYKVCHTYPAVIVIPNQINEENVKKISRNYKGNRLPVITWRHEKRRSLLVRGASFNTKGVMGMLRGTHHTPGGGVTDAAAHVEHENFLRSIANATPPPIPKSWKHSESDLELSGGSGAAFSQMSPSSTGGGNFIITPSTKRKSSNPMTKFVNTLRYATGTSGGKGLKNFQTMGSKQWKQGSASASANSHQSLTFPNDHHNNRLTLTNDSILEMTSKAKYKTLYVLGEKSQIKAIKPDPNSKIEYVAIELIEARQSRASFKKLMRACIPSALPKANEEENSFLKTVDETGWIQQLQTVMEVSSRIVKYLNDGASVMLCLEDGADMTSQISSIAQLCLDKHYRTIEGFQDLIEKEWLAFGHRFAHRNNTTSKEGVSSNPGFAPIFIQFLDVVHQIQKQFPFAFEFNEFYLKFLAYHSVSGRFRTFLADNELERVEYGFMALDDKRGSLPRHYKIVGNGSDDESFYPQRQLGSNSHQHLGISIFEYMEKYNAKLPIFINFLYEKDNQISVLETYNNIRNLDVWDYYLYETLKVGSFFDLEIALHDSHYQDEENSSTTELNKNVNRDVIHGYDIIENQISDCFRQKLSGIHRMEGELGLLPQKWKTYYDTKPLAGITPEKCRDIRSATNNSRSFAFYVSR